MIWWRVDSYLCVYVEEHKERKSVMSNAHTNNFSDKKLILHLDKNLVSLWKQKFHRQRSLPLGQYAFFLHSFLIF